MSIDIREKFINLKKEERWVIAGSAYQSIKYIVDLLNQQDLVKGNFQIHYPKTIQVDEDIFDTSEFEDKVLTEILK